MNTFPVEIWEKILANLQNPKDCENASNSCSIFYNILYSQRTSWLFGQVLPLISDHPDGSSREDIYQCRLVCKRWCHGVDHFGENNVLTRPHMKATTGETKVKYVNTVHPFISMEWFFWSRGFRRTDLMSPEVRQHLIDRFSGSSRSPLIGKTVQVYESNDGYYMREPSNQQVLRLFGHQVKYMIIKIKDLPEYLAVNRIMNLLKFVPNLRKIELRATFTKNPKKHELKDFQRSKLAAEVSKLLPNLESADIEIVGHFTDAVVHLFSNCSLKSWKSRIFSMPLRFNTAHLTDLNIQLRPHHVKCLIKLDAPLKHLYLVLTGDLDPSNLFEAITHFKITLFSLGIYFRDIKGWYNERESWHIDDLNLSKEELQKTAKETALRRREFMNVNVLNEMHNLRELKLEGRLPSSLNFICGLSNLEYLHTDLSHVQDRNEFEKSDTGCPGEKLDLSGLFPKYLFKKLPIYDLNVWIKFPRLKHLVISTMKEYPYIQQEGRRDDYEKNRENQIILYSTDLSPGFTL